MNQIQFQLISFENKYAILKNPIYGTIKWPVKELPADIEIGHNIKIGVITTDTPIQTDVKKLLEELIN